MDKTVYRWVMKAFRQYPTRSISVVILSILTSLADGLSISLLIPFLAAWMFSDVGAVPTSRTGASTIRPDAVA